MSAWNNIKKILNEEPWKTEMEQDSTLKGIFNNLNKSYESWMKKNSKNDTGNPSNEPTKVGSSINDWNPNLTFKIDV